MKQTLKIIVVISVKETDCGKSRITIKNDDVINENIRSLNNSKFEILDVVHKWVKDYIQYYFARYHRNYINLTSS